jgi:broad specificity phosphatase PhoE
MPGSLILVRHARPDMSGQRPGTWALADDGIDDARQLGIALSDLVTTGVDGVLSSTEPKANETAAALGLGAVHPDERLREVDRPWYDDQTSFSMAARRYLSGVPVAGWEPLDDAVSRFGTAVSGLDGMHIVVSHGTVRTAGRRVTWRSTRDRVGRGARGATDT